MSEILVELLRIGQREMNNQVEIEFAVTLDTGGEAQIFHFLQIRPVVEAQEKNLVKVAGFEPKDTIIYSKHALGNGAIDAICDLVYVRPETFDPANSTTIAEVIDKLNGSFMAEGRNYILVGPGRWGSSDPWLGIPVKWANISAARLIVEAGLDNFRIDPSQGTHFFQNLTSFRVGYFTINPFVDDGYYDVDYLDKQEAVYEDAYLRHVRFDKPISIKIDGSAKAGIVLKGKK